MGYLVYVTAGRQSPFLGSRSFGEAGHYPSKATWFVSVGVRSHFQNPFGCQTRSVAKSVLYWPVHSLAHTEGSIFLSALEESQILEVSEKWKGRVASNYLFIPPTAREGPRPFCDTSLWKRKEMTPSSTFSSFHIMQLKSNYRYMRCTRTESNNHNRLQKRQTDMSVSLTIHLIFRRQGRIPFVYVRDKWS